MGELVNLSPLVDISTKQSGVYKVFTETSLYIIDRDRDLGLRIPGEGLGSANGDPVRVAELRDNGKWFNIIFVYCRVGERLELTITGVAPDNIVTRRTGTIVRRIEPCTLTKGKVQ